MLFLKSVNLIKKTFFYLQKSYIIYLGGGKLYERDYGKGEKYQEQNNRYNLIAFGRNKIKCESVKAHEIHVHMHNKFYKDMWESERWVHLVGQGMGD